MALMNCGECGLPKMVAYMHRWRDDGVVESKLMGLRGVLVERGLIVDILDEIGAFLGISIDKIVVEAKRRDAKLYVDDVLSGALGRLVRFPLFRKMAYLITIRQAAMLGLGKFQLLHYRKGETLVGRAETVYHNSLFVGDVCGAFESIEGSRAKPFYNYLGKHIYVEVSSWKDAPVEERLYMEKLPVIPAHAGYERCSSCGVPREVRNFSWRPAEGKIIDGTTGEWVIYVDVEGINAVFRELEKELGEEIPRIIAETTFRFYRGLIYRHPQAPLARVGFMKARGFGIPDREDPSEEELREGLMVRNPFSIPIVAGIVAAHFAEDEKNFSWKMPEEGTVAVSIHATQKEMSEREP